MAQGRLWPAEVPKNKYSLSVRSAIILRHMRLALIKEEEEEEEGVVILLLKLYCIDV